MANIPFLHNAYFSSKVGIGTDGPQQTLSISGGNAAVNNGNSFTVGGAISGNTIIGHLKSDSGVFQLLSESTRDIKFSSTTYGDIMFLEGTNGNVGIGTTSPNYRLSVDDATITNIPKTLLQLNSGVITDNGGYNIDFRTSSSSLADRYVSRIRGIREAAGALSQLSFWTESGSALVQRMTIRASGNVGIGTTTPTEELEVAGTIRGERIKSIGTLQNQFYSTTGQAIVEIKPSDTRTGIQPILQYRNTTNGSANMLMVDGSNTFFTLYNGGIPSDKSDMIRISPNHASNAPSMGIGDSGSGDAHLDIGDRVRIANASNSYFDGGNVGIGITNPTSPLHVNQTVTDPDLDMPSSFAVEIDSNHSGSTATTGDREQGGLFIDVDSSTTGGDITDEHRLYGIYNIVNHSGDADMAQGAFNQVEQNTTTGTTTWLRGLQGTAISDGGSGAILSNLSGVFGSASLQDSTPVSSSYAGRFDNISISNRTGLTTNAFGILAEVQIDSTSTITNIYAGKFVIDSNAAYTATNAYLLLLAYEGTSLATNTYAIYSGSDVKSYHKGNFGFGGINPTEKIDVNGGIRLRGALKDVNNVAGNSGQILSSTGTTVDWVDASTVIGGPYLPLAGGTMAGNIKFPNGIKSLYGTGDVLQVGHTGVLGQIANYTGSLYIDNNAADTDIVFRNDDGSGGLATYFYLDGSLVNGTSVTGATRFPDASKIYMGSGGDLEIFHDGSNSYIDETGTGSLIIKSSPIIEFKGANNEYLARFIENGSIDLYYNNALKFETTGTGVAVLGTIDMNASKIIDLAQGTANTDAVNVQQLNNATTGVLVYQGVWNATTNIPALASGTGTEGYYYICNVAGSTNLDGITDWKVGDWAVFVDIAGGDVWQKIDNSSVLDGAGTGGTLPIWSGTGTSVTLSDSNFKQVATANRVIGPGNTGTDFSLEVQNAATTNAFRVGGSGIVEVLANYFYVSSSAGMYTNGPLRARAGITDDQGALDLGGNGSFTNLVLTSNTLAAFKGDVDFTTANSYLRMARADGYLSPTLRIDSATDDLIIGDTSIDDISIVTDNGEAVRVRGNGMVGIGKFPSYQLDVEGSVRIIQTAGTDPFLVQTAYDRVGKFESTDAGAFLCIQDSSSTNNGNGINVSGDVLNLQTAGSGKVYVLANGNVGIGTSSPRGNLDVVGNTDNDADFLTLQDNDPSAGSSRPSIRFRSNTAQIGQIVGLNGSMRFSSGSTETSMIEILDNGNVGIGMSNPGSPLAIKSNSTSSSSSGLTIQANGNTNDIFQLGEKSTDGSRFQMLDAGVVKIALYSDGSDNYINAGNVGIGNTSPYTKLLVGSRGTAGAITPSTIDGLAFDFHNDGSPYTRHGAIISQAGDASESVLDFWTKAASGTNSKKMTIRGDGNVGVGTTSPGAPLHVAADSAFKVIKLAGDLLTHYSVSGSVDHTLTLECGSYYQAEVIITANQTNGGTYNNIYVRGIWSNNHTSHQYDEIENIGNLTGSDFTITVSQAGTTNSGKLVIFHDYVSGSFSNMTVRVTDFYGTHTYAIT